MMQKLLPVTCFLLLAACSVHLPKPTPFRELEVQVPGLTEALLLDVAISRFTFPDDSQQDTSEALAYTRIRQAEALYMPVILQHTLMQTANWGSIHVVPEPDQGYDLQLEGEILESSSLTLSLRIRVKDASGQLWFERTYTEHVGDNVYAETSLGVNDPFQGNYNRIANDLLNHLQTRMDASALAGIRQLSELKFAQAFAPEIYRQYLATDRRQRSSILHLPAAGDPVHARLLDIRQRDRQFLDTLQQHYFNYARKISDTYFQYRRFSFQELKTLKEQQVTARNQILGGVFWLGVAVATSDIDNILGSTATAAATIQGVSNISQGVRGFPDKEGFLDELNQSFAGDVISEVIELDERVIILSGTADEIYQQWQGILLAMYEADREL